MSCIFRKRAKLTTVYFCLMPRLYDTLQAPLLVTCAVQERKKKQISNNSLMRKIYKIYQTDS